MSILSQNQRKILGIISEDKWITENFYLSGGTALAEFYLEHRLSEDLDFFSEIEFDPQFISVFFQKIKDIAGILSFKFEQSFNRNLFFLEMADGDYIKTEFTYYPFPRIEDKRYINKLKIDSLVDIAVNKTFTIYQNPRSRDFIDLYLILQEKKEWNIENLMKQAKIKFDYHIDPLQLAGQFMKATEVKDYPRMIKNITTEEWQNFFLAESKKLSESELS